MAKIKIKPIKQSRGYCGPACLKMILDYYGIKLSQNKIAKLTKTSRIYGCREKNIVKLAKKLGFKAIVKANSNINELRKLTNKGIPVIAAWTSPEEGSHYSVISGFQGRKILIADSHFGRILKKDMKWFEERWFDKVDSKLIKREVIIIKE